MFRAHLLCVCSSGSGPSQLIPKSSGANVPFTTSATAVKFLLAGSIILFTQILCGDHFFLCTDRKYKISWNKQHTHQQTSLHSLSIRWLCTENPAIWLPRPGPLYGTIKWQIMIFSPFSDRTRYAKFHSCLPKQLKHSFCSIVGTARQECDHP